MSDWSHTFHHRGDFAAFEAACDYLAARGFRYGPIERGSKYIAVMHGESSVAGWSKLSPEDLNDIHGRLESPDFRSGPVTLSIRPDVPGLVLEAICASEPEAVAG